MLVIIIIKLLM